MKCCTTCCSFGRSDLTVDDLLRDHQFFDGDATLETIVELFNKFDADGNQTLEDEEIDQFLNALYDTCFGDDPEQQNEREDTIFGWRTLFDGDENGRIDISEFYQAMKVAYKDKNNSIAQHVDVHDDGMKQVRIPLPSTPFYRLWTAGRFFAVMYYLICTPIRASFMKNEYHELLPIDYLCDAFCITDLVLSIVVFPRVPGYYFLTTFRFWCHLIANFPTDQLMNAAGHEWEEIYWARMLKLLRMVDLFAYVDEFIGPAIPRESVVRNPIVSIMMMATTWLFIVAHLSACLMYTIGIEGKKAGETNWLDEFGWECEEYDVDCGYFNSLYFIVVCETSVGYGDYLPFNQIEVMFIMFVMCFGFVCYACIVGMAVPLITAHTADRYNFLAKEMLIHQFLKNKKAPDTFFRQILRYQENLWLLQKGIDENYILYHELPRNHRIEVARHLCGDVLSLIPFLKKAPEGVILGLMSKIRSEVYGPNDIVVTAGQMKTSLYCLMEGKAETFDTANPAVIFDSIPPNSFFGDDVFLFEDEPFKDTVRVSEFSTIYHVTPDDFAIVIRPFTKFGDSIKQLQMKYATYANGILGAQRTQTIVKNDVLSIDEYAILPDSYFSYLWTIMMWVGTIYMVICVPMRVAFYNPDETKAEEWFWLAIDYTWDLFFLFDMVLRARYFAIPDPQDPKKYITDRAVFGPQYLKGWWWVDLMALLPLELVAYSVSHRFNYFFRLNRLIRFLHVFTYESIILQYLTKRDGYQMGVTGQFLRLMFFIIVFTHVSACIWYTVAWIQYETPFNTANGSWASNDGILPSHQIKRKYGRAMYWSLLTMTTVGYGGITPANLDERKWSIFFIYIGTSTFFLMSARLGAMAENTNQRGAEWDQRMQVVDAFVKHRLPQNRGSINMKRDYEDQVTEEEYYVIRMKRTQLKKRIKEYFQYIWSVQRGYSDSEILDELPSHMRISMMSTLVRPVFYKIEVLKGVPSSFLDALMLQLEMVVFSPGDVIMEKHDPVEQATFILDGDVIQGEDEEIKIMSDGQGFGTESLIEFSKSQSTFTALSFVSTAQLTKSNFDEIVEDYPRVYAHIEKKKALLQTQKFFLNNLAHDVDATDLTNLIGAATNITVDRDTMLQNAEKKKKMLDQARIQAENKILKPDHKFRLYWNLVSSILIFWNVIIVPFRIAFDRANDFNAISATLFIDLAGDIFFLVDIYLRFTRFAVYENGILQTEQKVIAKLYKRAVAWDVIGTLFFDIAFIGTNNQVCYWLHILRLTRLHRYYQYMTSIKAIIARWTGSSHIALVKIGELFLQLICVVHWLSCFWHYISDQEDDPENWTNQSPENMGFSRSSFYAQALYFVTITISTIGYGDYKPITLLETAFGLLAMLLGSVFYDMFTGNVASMASNLDVTADVHQRRLNTILNYLNRRDHVIPRRLIQRIEHHYEALWNRSKGVEESEILAGLPISLRKDICTEIHGDNILRIPIFTNLPISFNRRLTSSLEVVTYNKGDFITHRRYVCHDIYMLTSGRASVINPHGDLRNKVLHVLSPGSVIGEDNIREPFPKPQNYTIQASAPCELICVRYSALKKLFLLYPKVKDQLMENIDKACLEKVKKMRAYAILKRHLQLKASAINDLSKRLESKKSTEYFIRKPESQFYAIWHLVALFQSIIVYVILIPLLIAFTDKTDESVEWWWLIGFSWVTDMFFLFDTYLAMRVFAPDDHNEYTPADITRAYFARGHLFVFFAFLRAFPLDMCFAAILSPYQQAVIRIPKMLYILNITHYRDVTNRHVLSDINFKARTIGQLFFAILLVLHEVACFVYWCGSPDPEDFPEDTTSWVNLRTDSNGTNLVEASSRGGRYLYATYFAVTTITTTGYGDFYATTIGEIIFILCVVLFAAVINASMIGAISNYTSYKHDAHSLYTNRMSVLKQYLHNKACLPSLQKRILRYHEYIHSNDTLIRGEKILRWLPTEFRREVAYQQYRHLVSSIGFLCYNNQGFLSHVASLLKPQVFLMGEYLLNAGTVSSELLFIYRGLIEILLREPPNQEKKKRSMADIESKVDNIVRSKTVVQKKGSAFWGSASADQDKKMVYEPTVGYRPDPRIILDPKGINGKKKEYIGELSFFLFLPTTAHLCACSDVVEVLGLSRPDFDSVLKSYPSLTKTVAEKLKEELNWFEGGVNDLKPPPPFTFIQRDDIVEKKTGKKETARQRKQRLRREAAEKKTKGNDNDDDKGVIPGTTIGDSDDPPKKETTRQRNRRLRREAAEKKKSEAEGKAVSGDTAATTTPTGAGTGAGTGSSADSSSSAAGSGAGTSIEMTTLPNNKKANTIHPLPELPKINTPQHHPIGTTVNGLPPLPALPPLDILTSQVSDGEEILQEVVETEAIVHHTNGPDGINGVAPTINGDGDADADDSHATSNGIETEKKEKKKESRAARRARRKKAGGGNAFAMFGGAEKKDNNGDDGEDEAPKSDFFRSLGVFGLIELMHARKVVW